MADGFLASHVPQQSRRDKLRILSHPHPHPNPVYDPSLLHIPADLLPCTGSFPSSSTSEPSPSSLLVKEEPPSTLLSFPGNRCSRPDPQPSSSVNPNPIPDALIFPREWAYPSVSEVFTSITPAGNNCRGLSLSLSSRGNFHGDDDPIKLRFQPSLESYGSASAYGGDKGSCSGYFEVPRGSVPLGPFTGYSSILRGSRFLKPAQKLLEELCDVGRGMFYAGMAADAESSLMEGAGECFGSGDDRQGVVSGEESYELGGQESRLISMLDEVCRRYAQYYQQLQDVVASFECVAGIGNVAPYVNLALKAMSKHFRCLKDAIMDQLQFTSKTHRKPADTRDDIAGLGSNGRLHFGQRAIKNSGYLQQPPIWRPQRGLPERAVAVLRAWLFEHFLHPYPTDTDKLMLAKQTGLSRCQVSNWFINARVRLWKPMVEEIHSLETQQMQASQATCRDKTSATQASNDPPPPSSSVLSSRLHEMPPPVRKTTPTSTDLVQNEQTHFYLSHAVLGESTGGATTSNSVTLTLGLHQQHNNRVGATGEGRHQGMGGYELQDRQIKRGDVYDGHGQILNDFVG
ncbi:hypothetical protein MLD38_026527 [Melastoma candidum]|uniref:Uncharacterized protein n=1 Tax=Melastoma candidum TaxID=119954 RepID=A0ACB9P098_9MYRT|nr:hypothetical protein MLD38_026527 [Melastoma candidum]